MQKRFFLGLAIAFSTFMLVFSGNCFAQGQQGQGQGQGQPQAQGQEQGRGGGQGQMPAWLSATDNMAAAFIKENDKNGDGKVAKDEFTGPETLFTGMDTNGDGYVELSEAPTSMDMVQKLMGSGPGGGQGGGPGGGQGGAPPSGGGAAPSGN